MKLEGYKAGIYTRVDNYRAFILSKVNYSWSWEDSGINKLLEEAGFKIGELNAYFKLIPNLDMYIKMCERIEACKSNKIDKVETKIEEILGDIKDVSKENRDNVKQTLNYIKAMNYGMERIRENALLDTSLIKEIHNVLFEGKEDEKNIPGELRNTKIWIRRRKH